MSGMAGTVAAVGITPRSSSAVFVTVAGPPGDPRLIDRRRIDLIGDDLPAQAYHAAVELPAAEAKELVERWARAALEHAARSVADVVRIAGPEVVAVAIVAEVRDVPPLAVALRSHPLLHAGEGQLAREALAEAAGAAGLVVHHVSPREPIDAQVTERVAALGVCAGPPWRKEHKLAAAAALRILDGARRGPPRGPLGRIRKDLDLTCDPDRSQRGGGMPS